MPLSLYFLSDPKKVHDFNGAMADEAKIVKNHTPILNVFDVVTQAIAQCALHEEKIRYLVISGHGTRYHARFGNDHVGLEEIDSHAPVLRRLRPLFEPDAVVTLWGCSVGQNMALLQKLSFILGVKVQGSTEDITVGTWGPFKYMSSADMNACVYGVCGRGESNFDPRYPPGYTRPRVMFRGRPG
jgi:hypothetical protein